MIRSALLLCAGIIAAACVACVAATPPAPMAASAPPPPPPTAPMPMAAAVPACAFNNVTMVSPPNFDPTNANTTPNPGAPIPQYVQSDLTAALALAPPFFQKQLCGLDGIFIAASGDSWGFRNIKDGKRYLALSLNLWSSQKVPAFSAYENIVVHRLLKGWRGPNHPLKGDSSDGAAVTVLAALAHEFGHILFYDTFVNPRGTAPKYGAFCGGNFFSQSWQSMPDVANVWRTYGDVVGTHKAGDVQIQEILNAVPPPGGPDIHGAGGLLNRIYSLQGSGHWASFFAAFSPDEDFVETFKLFVLKNSGVRLQSLKMEIPIAGLIVTQDIPGTCSQRPVLASKLNCFAQTFCPGPTIDPCGAVCAGPK
jgi:hypothetical protein